MSKAAAASVKPVRAKRAARDAVSQPRAARAKKEKPAPPPPEEFPLTAFQKFEYREIPRRLLQNSPYNPNIMNDYNFKLLEKKMKAVGLLGTVVWNESTGNIVGGHHRVRVLDKLEGSADYTLGVAVVHLSPAREKEMNIFLNNARVQGAFDQEKFFKLLSEEKMDLADLGLTKLDLEMEFGTLPDYLGASMMAEHDAVLKELEAEAKAYHPEGEKAEAGGAESENTEGTSESTNTTDATAPASASPFTTDSTTGKPAITPEAKAKMKAARRSFREQQNNAAELDKDYYVVLVFENAEQKTEFLTRRDLPLDSPYVTAYHAGLMATESQKTPAESVPQEPVAAGRLN